MNHLDIPVLIVGAGGAGLTASMLFSDLGIESLAISSTASISVLPKAHVLQQRSMEVYRKLGVADDIYAQGTPAENMAATGWYAGLVGKDPIYGKEIARQESWGAGYQDPDYVAASPCRQTNLPQIRLEPILLKHAREKSPEGVLFNHELISFEQDDDGVTSTVLNKETGETFTVRSAYLLGCDGGRTVGNALGIDMQGERNILYSVSVHFSADLSQHVSDPGVLIRWMWPAHTGLLTLLIPMGPEKWGPESEEWVFHENYAADDRRIFDDGAMVADMKMALGLPDLEPEVHKITRWSFEALVAERFQENRAFLLGDAAHRHGPTGGLGLNTAIQDAYNICWKIAAVLRRQASPELLATYEQERRPVAVTNVRRSTENALNHMAIGQALGVSPTQSEEENLTALKRIWSDDPAEEDFRAKLRFAIAAQSMEFREHNIEFGYRYESQAVVADGSPEPQPVEEIRIYEPSARPGSPLPHAWLEDHRGNRIAIQDIGGVGQYVLVAGEAGAGWVNAVRSAAAEEGIDVLAITVGHTSGDYLDPRCAWTRYRGHGPAGAVLIRPDKFVAWRANSSVGNPTLQARDALLRIMHKR
ncbi:FAD-dependent monooxygenase [Arthrobacter jiangjiafuii]|uniref:FAD-dependent monooxygenase n=1 Tax=Arthrobacter jiangjiafuii TaxID=2817475 RepID=A0A975R2C4_9MICC|nr:FAD-dependent monooxygenase [Arthrobacter jiangjiafuii]MBP3044445.1 FAD-dependent monooxygenase [Arthrobacter jiangjiafuii]QWC11389.1 FAD-dependent monooxygenase [Arthrobacter jiangjiafuii]